MNKIEDKLAVKESIDSILLMNVLDEFYKETNMLFNNIYIGQTLLNEKKVNEFPQKFNLYDGAWYKNILISADMLIDRFHFIIDETKDYTQIFSSNNYDFTAFAKKWNQINYIVKFNLEENIWKQKAREWKLTQTTIWLNELLALNTKINNEVFKNIQLDMDLYEPLIDSIGNNGFDALIEYITKGKQEVNKNQTLPINNQSKYNDLNTAPPAKDIDPNSPEGVDLDMTEVIKWIDTKYHTIRLKNASEREELPEVSPVKKTMDEILKWIGVKEKTIQSYSYIKKYGFDPYEFVSILKDLDKVRNLKNGINDEVANLLKFAETNNPEENLKPVKQAAKKFNRRIAEIESELFVYNGDDYISELKKLSSSLTIKIADLNSYEMSSNQEINELKKIIGEEFDATPNLVSDPLVTSEDYSQIIKDEVSSELQESTILNKSNLANENKDVKELTKEQSEKEKEQALINSLQKSEVNNDINETKANSIDQLAKEKIELINDELNKINKIIKNTSNKDQKEKPISAVRDEMEQLIIWINLKLSSVNLNEKKYLMSDEYQYENSSLNNDDLEDYSIDGLLEIKDYDAKNNGFKTNHWNNDKPVIFKEISENKTKEIINETPPTIVEQVLEPQVVEPIVESNIVVKKKAIELKIKNRSTMNSMEELFFTAMKEKEEKEKELLLLEKAKLKR